jgi:methionine aminopeptidase
VSIGCLADLESLLRIGRIVGRVLRELEEQVLAGVTTAELDRAAARALFRFGARPTPSNHAYKSGQAIPPRNSTFPSPLTIRPMG